MRYLTISIFQFHKGSIKTYLEEDESEGLARFKFQKGSIKTQKTKNSKRRMHKKN